MMSDRAKDIVREGFLELTLCLEAIFTIYEVAEDLVEEIMRSMEEIYRNTMRSLTELEERDPQKGKDHHSVSRRYPAIERFLNCLDGKNLEGAINGI
jgi:hypothetical protein